MRFFESRSDWTRVAVDFSPRIQSTSNRVAERRLNWHVFQSSLRGARPISFPTVGWKPTATLKTSLRDRQIQTNLTGTQNETRHLVSYRRLKRSRISHLSAGGDAGNIHA